MNIRVIVLVLAASSTFALGCNDNKSKGGESTSSTTAAVKVDSAQAKTIFNERCAACHGPDGDGKGPGAAALNPKPRNYHDKSWQSSVTDEQIKKTITMGGAAVGKSPIMPASPDLDSKPEVVEGLVQIIRGFGK